MHHTMKNNHPKSSAVAGLKKLFSGRPTLCLLAANLFANLAVPSAQADVGLTIQLDGDNASVSWNATASGSANLEHSVNLSSWSTLSPNNTEGSFLHAVGNSKSGFYRLKVVGLFAKSPGLASSSDTGSSAVDGVTNDRTPTFLGSVLGAASHVRISINGQLGELVPVENGMWTYTVPAEAPLSAGIHTITVTPVDALKKAGERSLPLFITLQTTPPAPPTLALGDASDTGVKGDGRTTESEPLFSGTAPLGSQVKVTIDGVVAGQAQADAQTGMWSFQSPPLANGSHEVLAVATGEAGLESSPASFTVVVGGPRTVMLDASSGTTELMSSHILGGRSQGFIVTKVYGGTLRKWVASDNAWQPIPVEALGTAPTTLENAPAIRTILFTDIVRWTPAARARGMGAAFEVIPLDRVGGATQPVPAAGTVPGNVVNASIQSQDGVGSTITWSKPIDGCGCPSTQYSIQAIREDGQTLVYNLPYSAGALSIVEGGAVMNAKIWGATKTGAGEARSYDAIDSAKGLSRLTYTVASAASFVSLGDKARAQLRASRTPTRFSTSLPLGNANAHLAYLEVQAPPDANEAAQGQSAESPMIISSDSNKLTPAQRAELKANPIYASHLIPGTVGGEVAPDQIRAHFQAGKMLRFAGNVDASVRAGATIVMEKAQNLQDGSLGPWFEQARIAVGADGSFSHKYSVPHGMNSVRVRLEYQTQPAAPSVGATSSTATPISTPIDLSTYFNAFGITTQPWQVPNHQGFDGNGNYFNSDYTGSGTSAPIPGTPIIYNGISFPIGPIPTAASQVGGSGNSAQNNPPNFVRATGQTIQVSVDADKSDYLYLAGAASNGNQLSQTITLNFTDGTTEKWTQSFHDWASDGPPQSSNPPWPPAYTIAPGDNQKLPVRVATTAPVQFSGLQTIDGVALVEGDRVLVKKQTDEQYNGIYIASAGAWLRAKDALTPEQQWNETVSVLSGTKNGGKYFWENTSPFAISNLQTDAAGLRQIIERKERELIEMSLYEPIRAEQLEQEIAGYVEQLRALEPKIAALIAMEYPITFVKIAPPVPSPRPFAGELNLKTEPERINQLGDLVTTPAHIFGYCRNLHGKQLASFTLPNNQNIGILSAVVSKAPVIALDQGVASILLATTHLTGVDLVALTIANESNIGAGGGPLTFFFADQPEKGSTTTPPTYTTKQVTVPMGQQTTIAYIAPDSSSQMTFSVQKADGTCVGADCSTYLTDWADGSGSSINWAANLSPSLNSQINAGQQWTMTIQNAGLGYNGYLSSPSGKKLPAGGAQFKLMTQNEINDQPPWAVALEKIGGEAIALVGITILTAGTGDAAIVGAEVVDATVEIGGEAANLTIISEVDSIFETDSLVTIEEDVSVDGEAFGSFIEEEYGPFDQELRSQLALIYTDTDYDAAAQRIRRDLKDSFKYIEDPNF